MTIYKCDKCRTVVSSSGLLTRLTWIGGIVAQPAPAAPAPGLAARQPAPRPNPPAPVAEVCASCQSALNALISGWKPVQASPAA